MSISYSLQALADYLSVESVEKVRLEGDPARIIHCLNSLQDAKDGDLAFIASSAFYRYLSSTRASCVIISPEYASDYSGNKLIADNPYVVYARLSRLFDTQYQSGGGIHSSASISDSADLGEDVFIGANVVLSANVVISDRVHIGSGTVVEEGSTIGAGSFLHANVSLYSGVSIGQNVVIHSGVVIGADGFGFANDRGRWIKIHQMGGVEIGDNVEIGAGTTIDRGAIANTRIGNGVIIDNLVQIAHNVEIGDNSAIAGCAAIAGSTRIGKHCVLAGGAVLVGHIDLCDGVTVTARTMVTKSISEPGTYSSGVPFEKNRQWRKNAVRFSQLDKMARRLSILEKRKK